MSRYGGSKELANESIVVLCGFVCYVSLVYEAGDLRMDEKWKGKNLTEEIEGESYVLWSCSGILVLCMNNICVVE